MTMLPALLIAVAVAAVALLALGTGLFLQHRRGARAVPAGPRTVADLVRQRSHAAEAATQPPPRQPPPTQPPPTQPPPTTDDAATPPATEREASVDGDGDGAPELHSDPSPETRPAPEAVSAPGTAVDGPVPSARITPLGDDVPWRRAAQLTGATPAAQRDVVPDHRRMPALALLRRPTRRDHAERPLADPVGAARSAERTTGRPHGGPGLVVVPAGRSDTTGDARGLDGEPADVAAAAGPAAALVAPTATAQAVVAQRSAERSPAVDEQVGSGAAATTTEGPTTTEAPRSAERGPTVEAAGDVDPTLCRSLSTEVPDADPDLTVDAPLHRREEPEPAAEAEKPARPPEIPSAPETPPESERADARTPGKAPEPAQDHGQRPTRPGRDAVHLAAERAAADLALLRTFGPTDLGSRPDRAPVVALESPPGPEREPAVGAAQPVRFRAVRRDGSTVGDVGIALLDDRGREASVGRSDAAGAGELAAPYPGSYVLVATAPDHQPGAVALSVVDAPVDAEVLLVRSASLAGTVTDEDGPVDGARVTLVQDGEVVETANTDSGGSYRIVDLAAGEYAVSVAAAGCEPDVALVSIPDEADAAHHVELEPASVAAG